MADNSSRWQRVASQPGDKPRFEARQSTEQLVEPREEHAAKAGRTPSPERTTLLWIIGVLVLTGLVGLLAWQLLVN